MQALVSCVAPPLLAAATTVDAEAFHYALNGVSSDLTTALSVPHVRLTTEAATCAAHTLSHLYAVVASRCDHLTLPSASVATAQLNAAVALLAEATAAALWPGQAATQWATPQFTLAVGVVPAGGALQLTLPGLQATLHAPAGGLRDSGGQPIGTTLRIHSCGFPVRKGVEVIPLGLVNSGCVDEGRTCTSSLL